MYLCYIDESGTPEIPGNTSHFVLAGLSIPISYWRNADREVSQVLGAYGLENEELHTAWLLRKYLDQTKIPNFEQLDWASRRSAVLDMGHGSSPRFIAAHANCFAQKGNPSCPSHLLGNRMTGEICDWTTRRRANGWRVHLT